MISDFLAGLHTRGSAYRGLSLGLLGIAIFFAIRDGEMCVALMQLFGAGTGTWTVPIADVTIPSGAIGLFALQVILILTFAYLGFYLSTHQSYVLEAQLERISAQSKAKHLTPEEEEELAERAEGQFKKIILFIILADIGSSIYVIFSGIPNLTLATLTDLSLDARILGALAFWSLLIFVEFKIGPFLLALSETLAKERMEQFATEGIEEVARAKLKATKVGLRLINDMTPAQALRILRQSAGRKEQQNPLMATFLTELADVLPPEETAPQAPPMQPLMLAPELSAPLSSPPLLPEDEPPAATWILKEGARAWEEPEDTITDAQVVAVRVPVAAAPAKSNGHAAQKGAQAASGRSFRFPLFGWRHGDQHTKEEEDEEDDDWHGWDQ